MQIQENAELYGLWTVLARQAGVPVDGWRADVASRRSDAARHRVVWRLRGHGRTLALKWVMAPVDVPGFSAEVEAHLAIQDRFAEVPRLHAAEPERQAVLMDWAGSKTLFDALTGAGAQHRQRLMHRAGGWIARFHRSGFDERRVFQPKHSVRHLRRLMAEVAEGKRAVADAGSWLAHAERLCARQAEFEGQETLSCLGHGDLNLRNILIGEAVSGLDFRKGGPVPVGHDLARLFAHYGALLCAPGLEGETLPGVDLTGFFQGYDLAAPDDPSIRFLTLMRILIDWQTLPAKARHRSGVEARRLAGLQALAARAFGA